MVFNLYWSPPLWLSCFVLKKVSLLVLICSRQLKPPVSTLFSCFSGYLQNKIIVFTSTKSWRLSGSTQVKFSRNPWRTFCRCTCLSCSWGASRVRNTTAPSTKYRSTPVRMLSRVEQRIATPPLSPNAGSSLPLTASPLGESQLQLKHQRPQKHHHSLWLHLGACTE